MRLRKQLLIVSLITLALPWVGCQSVREMDNALKQGQTNALLATVKAVSARFTSDTQLIAKLPLKADSQPYYAQALASAPYIDGYEDDWISQGSTPEALNRHLSHTFYIGQWQELVAIFVKLESKHIKYFRPSQTNLKDTDYLELSLANKRFALFASGPGDLICTSLANGDTVNDQTREHRIKGKWLEHDTGVQVEFQLPASWLTQGLAMNFINNTTSERVPPAPVILPSSSLAHELAIFANRTTRLTLVEANGHTIARSGSITLEESLPEQHGLLDWVYGIALGNQTLPELAQTTTIHSIDDAISTSWFTLSGRPVVQITHPITDSNGTLRGVLIAEQSAQTLNRSTNQAFSKLLSYSFLAATLAAIFMVVYATWLSVRIKKLSDAAANAINDSGKISESFPVLTTNDEVGELSRSYAQLLARLREYTNYLRTLSSKLSHELRTPLAIVRSSLDNLEHEKLPTQAKTYAERAREGTTRLSSILNAMSAASRVEQAISASERERIPCDELLANLKAAYEDVYQHVQLKLNIRGVSKDLEIYGSGELLVQALDKLVDNAADFCPSEGKIELGLYRHNDWVVFTVHNEGPPLPSHMQGQLFDSMVSVRDTPSKGPDQGQHLGLGLYIVRLITDFHQGEVQGYNVPDNSGVIFELRLPAS